MKMKKYFSFGINKKWRLNLFIGIILGFLILVWGLLVNQSSFSFRGIDSKVFLGMYIILLSIFGVNKHLIHLTKRAIIFQDASIFIINKWEFEKIDQIVLWQNKIEIIRNQENHSFTLKDSEIKELSDLMREKLGEKFIIKNKY
ncbi:MAG: hypothetical protein R3342_07260 [Lutibacter sp.]|nr:hypothetical protein [Lutibacter sp.]